MLTDHQIKSLRAPFPEEALTPDRSRGFELTSIKAAYIIERLNDVFGPCGVGWRYIHAPFETLVLADQRTEILTEVALQYRISESDQQGCGPVEWRDGWRIRPDHPWVWSEPILAAGGKSLGKGAVPYTDARKSAVTDGLTKGASMLGIGHDIFKGLHQSGDGNGNGHRSNGSHAGGDATAFWKLYNSRAKGLGIPLETAKDLAGRGDWTAAYQDLQSLVSQAAA
jgi:hypothetical protein